MFNITRALIILVLFTACNTTKTTVNNTLSAAEQKEGYTLLFDGKTMNGWRTYQNTKNDSWSVDNGTLHCKGSSGNYGSISADLVTTAEYENFDLSVDWKISPKGNSGILYMVKEDSASSYVTGPEYQIIDDVNFPEHLEEWQKTGADYAMYNAQGAEPKPAGQWNRTRIVLNKNHVEHWLNGKKVVVYELYSDDWENRKREGKWKDHLLYGANRKGHITFQDHGSESWFKNIRLRNLF